MRGKFVLHKALLGIFLAIFIAVLGYGGYIYFTYDRVSDYYTLQISGEIDDDSKLTQNNGTYTIGTYNIGFGAYLPDFSYFLDGGESTRAKSRESCNRTATASANLAMQSNPDFMLFQEVDTDATRSYGVNQDNLLTNVFEKYNKTYATNFDSAYILYPFTNPVGKNISGMSTYSRYEVNYAVRRSLPVTTGFSKFVDLDRCYCVNHIPIYSVDGTKYSITSKELVIYNVHLSAHGVDKSVREKQLNELFEDIRGEIEAGNYVICGGDFNHDLRALEDSEGEFENWAYPFPRSQMPEGTRFAMDDLSKEAIDALVDSCRDPREAYNVESTKTYMLDGFIVSNNIKVINYEVVDSGFAYSDHQPVMMQFKLKN